MILADGCAGAFSLILALAITLGYLNVPLMLLLLAVRASAQAFHGPALAALMPHLVPERHLMRINSMDQTITSLSSIAGPALGILLYTFAGLQEVMFLDAACAAIACLCLGAARIPTNTRTVTPQTSVLGDLRDGAVFIFHDKGLRNLMFLIMITMLLFMPASSLTPFMTYQHFEGDGWQASLIKAVFDIGLLLGSALIMVWGGGKKHVPIIIASGMGVRTPNWTPTCPEGSPMYPPNKKREALNLWFATYGEFSIAEFTAQLGHSDSKSIRTCQCVAAPPCCEYTSNEHPESAVQRHLFLPDARIQETD